MVGDDDTDGGNLTGESAWCCLVGDGVCCFVGDGVFGVFIGDGVLGCFVGEGVWYFTGESDCGDWLRGGDGLRIRGVGGGDKDASLREGEGEGDKTTTSLS